MGPSSPPPRVRPDLVTGNRAALASVESRQLQARDEGLFGSIPVPTASRRLVRSGSGSTTSPLGVPR